MVPRFATVRHARDAETDKFDHRCWSFPRRRLSYRRKVQWRVSGSFFCLISGFLLSFRSPHRYASHVASEPFFSFSRTHVICGIGPSIPFIPPVDLSSWSMAVSPGRRGSSELSRGTGMVRVTQGSIESLERGRIPLSISPFFSPTDAECFPSRGEG